MKRKISLTQDAAIIAFMAVACFLPFIAPGILAFEMGNKELLSYRKPIPKGEVLISLLIGIAVFMLLMIGSVARPEINYAFALVTAVIVTGSFFLGVYLKKRSDRKNNERLEQIILTNGGK